MKTKQPELNKIIAFYERLSRDDEQSGDINPLTGLVYCADCGAKMFNHRTNGYEKKDKNGNPTGKYTNALDNYTCSTYSKALKNIFPESRNVSMN